MGSGSEVLGFYGNGDRVLVLCGSMVLVIGFSGSTVLPGSTVLVVEHYKLNVSPNICLSQTPC